MLSSLLELAERQPLVINAGVVVLGEGTLARQLFMNLVWLVGTYLFAAVLGVITGDIMERIQVITCIMFSTAQHGGTAAWAQINRK